MKTKYRKPLIYATAVLIPQLIAFLIDNSQGIAFLISLITLLAYELYRNTIDIRETVTALISFTAISLLISVIAKLTVYDPLCQLSQAAPSTSTVLSSPEACLSLIGVWTRILSANPVKVWYFWAASTVLTAAVVYLYRTYSEDR